MDTSIPDSVIDLTIEPELYLVVFPTEFPPEGECDEQDIDIGFTNSPAIGELMERSTRDPNLPKWEFADLSHLSKIAKERILMKHNIKKEDCVKVKGWDKEDYGLWITPGRTYNSEVLYGSKRADTVNSTLRTGTSQSIQHTIRMEFQRKMLCKDWLHKQARYCGQG